MPKDENKRNNNKQTDYSKRQTSFGSESPDDSLLRKAKDVIKDVSTSGGTSTNSGSNKKDSDNKYNAKGYKNNNRNNANSTNSIPINNKSDVSNRNNANMLNKGKKYVKKQAINAASLIPGVGQAIKGAQLAKNTMDKIKQRRNNPNSDGSKVGKGPDEDNENKNSNGKKEDNLKENSQNQNDSEEKSNNRNNLLSGLLGLGKLSLFQKIILFAIPILLLCMLFFTLLVMTAISSFTVEFVSSMVKGEKLTESFIFKSSSSGAKFEKKYIDQIEKVYNERNKNFNPDYVSSTLSVMMEHGQYARTGRYGYSDIIVTRKINLLLWQWETDDSPKIKKLADIFAKQPANASDSSNTNNNFGGTGEVAGDATTMVGSGHNLGEGYVPNVIDTGRMGVDGEMCKLTQETFDAFKKMEAGAAAQGVTIGVNSCYRSYAEQAVTTGNSPAGAGASEHQLGSTIDIADRDHGYITNETVLMWLNTHAAEYGFVRSLTDMGDERHHYRYVGTKVAAAFVDYINNGGVNYLDFQNSDSFNGIAGNTNSNNSNSNTNTSSTGSSNTTSQAQKMVELAQKEYSLTDGTNKEDANGVTKYGTWYGYPSADWCDIFIAWLANQAGIGEDVIPKAGGVANVRSFFESRGLFHPTSDGSYQAKPGDIIFYEHGHVGLVVENNNGKLVTIEGNSTITEDSIARKEGVIGDSTFYDVAGFASPNYSGEAVNNNTSDGTGGINTKFTDEVRNDLKEFLRGEEQLPKINDLDNAEAILDSLVDQIESRTKDYYDFIGKKTDECSTSTGSGNCDYNIKGFYYDGANHEQQLSISNLKVRLMDCSSRPIAIPGEELVDFEKYILGVVYAEIGEGAPVEAMKAQAIAARSYALSRPASMGNSGGTLLAQEDGQWILQLRACTMDQVYCDPDRGCAKTGDENSLTKSGTDWGGNLYKNPLPSDDPLRSSVEETKGKLLVNNEGYVINAGYLNTDQNQWSSMASSGKNYTDILIEHYNNSRNYGAKSIESMSCSGTGGSNNNPNCVEQNGGNLASGPYANWKQCDEKWGEIGLGGSTICGIGCLATSMSMLVAKSGVPTNVTGEFNPGSFIESMKSVGGFSGGGDYNWSVTPSVVPSYQDFGYLDYFPSDVAAKINQGYSGIVFVGKAGRSCHHWVAIDRVENGVVYILDPAGDNGPIDITYPNKCGVHYFKLK